MLHISTTVGEWVCPIPVYTVVPVVVEDGSPVVD